MTSSRWVLLLRGINLGPRNRIAMPRLRELLAGQGFVDVQTYLQSGNVVLSSDLGPAELEAAGQELIAAELGLDIPVVARSAEELAAVVAGNPLGEVVDNPKRYQVTFLRSELAESRIQELAALAQGGERLVGRGRELYAWHPDGVARSKLSTKLAGASLGVPATSRNWTTVTTLAEMAAAG